MQRKLGPLKTWQWLAMGAALGAAIYLYRRSHAGGGGATPNAAAVDPTAGPIDPTTGMPYAMGSGGGGTDPFAPDGSFANALGLLEEIQNSGLFGGTSIPVQGGVVKAATGDNSHEHKHKHKRSTTRNKGKSHGRPNTHHHKNKPKGGGTTNSAGAGHHTRGGRNHPQEHRPATHHPAHHQRHTAAYGHARRSF